MRIQKDARTLKFVATGTNHGRPFVTEGATRPEAMNEAFALRAELHGAPVKTKQPQVV